jgi:hypothetical protein
VDFAKLQPAREEEEGATSMKPSPPDLFPFYKIAICFPVACSVDVVRNNISITFELRN